MMVCPPKPPAMKIRVRALLHEWGLPIAELTVRIAAILLATALLLRVPLPVDGTSLDLVQALIILAAVALIGLALVETLFYNHYRS